MSSLPLILALALLPQSPEPVQPAVGRGSAEPAPALEPARHVAPAEPARLVAPAEPGARLEVLAGTVRLATGPAGPGVRELVAGATLRLAGEPAHLRVPAGARARVAWPGVGSLVLDGATTLEWSFERARLSWRLVELGGVDGEVRRGRPVLRLPNGWTATCREGAWRVTARATADPVVEHRAGLPLTLAWRGDGRARPPIVLHAGERTVLGEPADPARPDLTARARPWTLAAAAWPWSVHAAGRRSWPRGEALAPWPWAEEDGVLTPVDRPTPSASEEAEAEAAAPVLPAARAAGSP